MSDKLTDEQKTALKSIIDEFDREDQTARERQLRQWKQLKYLWAGFSNIWWSQVAHDWKIYGIGPASGNDQSYYDKPVNVFKAYLETIIAALSSNIPTINCTPDDADNADDLLTAKAGDKIAQLVFKHNDGPLLYMHALFIYCTEGMLAAYTYPKEDEKYGTYETPKYEEGTIDQQSKICPECKQPLQPIDFVMNADERDEFMPDDMDSIAHEQINDGKVLCSQCLTRVDPEIVTDKIIVTRLVGVTQKAKSRICAEAYGGLNVKVPNYARKQCECPYLCYSYETHYSFAVSKYPHLRDKAKSNKGSSYEIYEKWARVSTQYYGEFPSNTVTWRNWWIRPDIFETLQDESMRKFFKHRFPDGCKVVYCDDEYCESENEALDDCWTLAYNPLADYVHYEPIGLLLVSIQEIVNDVLSLTLQTVEHGIPQTFADPEVLNFPAYQKTEALPGQIFPAKPKSGKSMADAFYEVKTATLSQEVGPFGDKILELGQLVSGALPSLFGGSQPNSSKTAAQYSMSRNQAMQRLQNPSKILTFWWKNVYGKVIPMYIKTIKDGKYDERDVIKNPTGDFINVVIKHAELLGKLGDIELESSEQLPNTWGQVKDVVMQLMQTNNPEILAALTNPENISLLAEAIGLTDFFIPGEDDRIKQYEEIRQLLRSQPMPGSGMNAMPEMPSVDVEPLVDNHQIESDICRRWLVSEAGRQAKIENPSGYKNVLLHMQRHMNAMQMLQQTTGAQPPQQQGQKPAIQPSKQQQAMQVQ